MRGADPSTFQDLVRPPLPRYVQEPRGPAGENNRYLSFRRASSVRSPQSGQCCARRERKGRTRPPPKQRRANHATLVSQIANPATEASKFGWARGRMAERPRGPGLGHEHVSGRGLGWLLQGGLAARPPLPRHGAAAVLELALNLKRAAGRRARSLWSFSRAGAGNSYGDVACVRIKAQGHRGARSHPLPNPGAGVDAGLAGVRIRVGPVSVMVSPAGLSRVFADQWLPCGSRSGTRDLRARSLRDG